MFRRPDRAPQPPPCPHDEAEIAELERRAAACDDIHGPYDAYLRSAAADTSSLIATGQLGLVLAELDSKVRERLLQEFFDGLDPMQRLQFITDQTEDPTNQEFLKSLAEGVSEYDLAITRAETQVEELSYLDPLLVPKDGILKISMVEPDRTRFPEPADKGVALEDLLWDRLLVVRALGELVGDAASFVVTYEGIGGRSTPAGDENFTVSDVITLGVPIRKPNGKYRLENLCRIGEPLGVTNRQQAVVPLKHCHDGGAPSVLMVSGFDVE